MGSSSFWGADVIHIDTESMQTELESGPVAVENRILHPAILDDRINCQTRASFQRSVLRLKVSPSVYGHGHRIVFLDISRYYITSE